MKVKNLTGFLTGILIMLMLIFIKGIDAYALCETLQVDYSPDAYYKYESKCEYYGILADGNGLEGDKSEQFQDCVNTDTNIDCMTGEIFTGNVQLAERLNYIYKYKQEDNIYLFRAVYGYEHYDVDYIITEGLGAENSADAEEYLKRVLISYKITDSIYEYSNKIRIYMSYAKDIREISELSESIVSISDAQVDEIGNIYYDVVFDESADYYYIQSITEKFIDYEWNYYVSDIEFIYNLISSSERIVAEHPKDYNFDEWNEPVPTSPAVTTTEKETTTVNEPTFETTTATEPTVDATTQSPVQTQTYPVTTHVYPATTTTIPIQTGASTHTYPAVTTTTTPEEELPTETHNSPDINGDGTVSIADAVIMKKILEGNMEISSYYIDISDVNNDGVIDEFDYMTVCSNISGYTGNIKNITVNLNSVKKRCADCYVKIMSSKDLSDITGYILFQKNVFGKYITMITEDINAEGLYYIFNEKYKADSRNRYRLVADIFYDNRKISVGDNCRII